MSDQDGDLPKTVAVILTTIPSLVIGTGFAYLRTRRKARKSAKMVMKGMVESGVPPEMARKLADDYASQLSLRTIIRGFGPGTWSSGRARQQ